MTSGEYYQLYEKYHNEYLDYVSWITYLQGLISRIQTETPDKIEDVNNAIITLIDTLSDAVRFDSVWEKNTKKTEDGRETGSSTDSYLSGSISSLGNEIKSLIAKRDTAEANYISNYQNYLSQLAKEEEERREQERLEQERLEQEELEKKQREEEKKTTEKKTTEKKTTQKETSTKSYSGKNR